MIFYKLIQFHLIIDRHTITKELTALKLPPQIFIFALNILTSNRPAEDLLQNIISNISQINDSAGNPTRITKFSDYLYFVRKNLPPHLATTINQKLGLTALSDDTLDTAFDGLKLGSLDVESHNKSDMDTAVSGLLMAKLLYKSATWYHTLIKNVFAGNFREDTKRVINHFTEPNYADNIFEKKDDYSPTVWDIMKDTHTAPVAKTTDKLSELKFTTSNPNIFLIGEGNELLGELSKNDLALFKAILSQDIEDEIYATDFITLLHSKPASEVIMAIAGSKFLNNLTRENILLLQATPLPHLTEAIINKIENTLTLQDYLEQTQGDISSIKYYKGTDQIEAIRENLIKTKNTTPVIEEHNGKPILIGFISPKDIAEDAMIFRSGLLQVDHHKTPNNQHPNQPTAIIDHHNKPFFDTERTVLDGVLKSVINQDRNLTAPIILEASGSCTAIIVNQFATTNMDALSHGEIILGIAAIINDTDDLTASKLTATDIRALKTLTRELVTRLISADETIQQKYQSLMRGIDKESASESLTKKIIDTIFTGSKDEIAANLKKSSFINAILSETNAIIQDYQVELRETNSPDVFGFDSKVGKTSAISKLDEQGLKTPHKGRLHISQEKLELTTLERVGDINPNKDFDLMETYLKNVKGTDDQADAIIHMISMAPADIAAHKQDAADKNAHDYLEIYSTLPENLKNIMENLLQHRTRPFIKGDGSAFSSDEIKIKAFFSNKLENGKDLVYTANLSDMAYIKAKNNWQSLYEETAINIKGTQTQILKLKTEDINFVDLFNFTEVFKREGKANLAENVWNSFTGRLLIEFPPGSVFSRKKQVADKF